MTCARCRYWKADNVLGLSVSGAQMFGECRRYPPAPKWPSTEMEDWCGEFEVSPPLRGKYEVEIGEGKMKVVGFKPVEQEGKG